jgi:hypothetical protein
MMIGYIRCALSRQEVNALYYMITCTDHYIMIAMSKNADTLPDLSADNHEDFIAGGVHTIADVDASAMWTPETAVNIEGDKLGDTHVESPALRDGEVADNAGFEPTVDRQLYAETSGTSADTEGAHGSDVVATEEPGDVPIPGAQPEKVAVAETGETIVSADTEHTVPEADVPSGGPPIDGGGDGDAGGESGDDEERTPDGAPIVRLVEFEDFVDEEELYATITGKLDSMGVNRSDLLVVGYVIPDEPPTEPEAPRETTFAYTLEQYALNLRYPTEDEMTPLHHASTQLEEGQPQDFHGQPAISVYDSHMFEPIFEFGPGQHQEYRLTEGHTMGGAEIVRFLIQDPSAEGSGSGRS